MKFELTTSKILSSTPCKFRGEAWPKTLGELRVPKHWENSVVNELGEIWWIT